MSIVIYILGIVPGDQEENIGAAALVVMMYIDRKSEVPCFYDNSRDGALVEESRDMVCVMVHCFQEESRSKFGTIEMSGKVSACRFGVARGSHIERIPRSSS